MPSPRLALCALALLAGCPSPSTESVTFEAFPAEAARANCALLFRCCTPDEVSGIFTPGLTVTTQAECEAYFESLFDSEAAAAGPRIDAALLVWRGDVAGECIAAIDAASCPDVVRGVIARGITSDPDGLCAGRFEGVGADGEMCNTPRDCASGYCADDTRTCAPPPALGEPCVSRCAGELACDVRAETPTCVTRRPDGESCTPGFGEVCISGHCEAPGACGPRPAIMACTGAP